MFIQSSLAHELAPTHELGENQLSTQGGVNPVGKASSGSNKPNANLADLFARMSCSVQTPSNQSMTELVHPSLSYAGINETLNRLKKPQFRDTLAPTDAAIMFGIGICNSEHISDGSLPFDVLSLLTVALENAKVVPVPKLIVVVDDFGPMQSHVMTQKDVSIQQDKAKKITSAAANIKQTMQSVIENIFPSSVTGVDSNVMLTSDLLKMEGFPEFTRLVANSLAHVGAVMHPDLGLRPGTPTFNYYCAQLAVMAFMHDHMSVRARVGWAADDKAICVDPTAPKPPNDERLMQHLFSQIRPDALLPTVQTVQGVSSNPKAHTTVPYFVPPAHVEAGYRILFGGKKSAQDFFNSLDRINPVMTTGVVAKYEPLLFMVSALSGIPLRGTTAEKIAYLMNVGLGEVLPQRKPVSQTRFPRAGRTHTR